MELLRQLEALLAVDLEVMQAKEKELFDEKPRPFQDSIVLYGAGSLGKKIASGLRSIGIEPLAFTDSNIELWNTTIDNIKVMSPPDAVQAFGKSAVFVISIWSASSGNAFQDATNVLGQLGKVVTSSFVPLFYKYPHVFLPYYCLDLPHKIIEQADRVREAFLLMADEQSREEYMSHIKFRIEGDMRELKDPICGVPYFPEGLIRRSPSEVFVDCGAFNGDTLMQFLAMYDKFNGYVAFEPDPDNFRELAELIEALDSPTRRNIQYFNLAVGDEDKVVFFEAQGTAGSFISNSPDKLKVRCVALDRELKEINPTYIKMDIEGAEQDALKGAVSVIKKSLPQLAICAYHRPDDLWMIPLLIDSINNDYKLYYRRHEAEGWDLVCYAVSHNDNG